MNVAQIMGTVLINNWARMDALKNDLTSIHGLSELLMRDNAHLTKLFGVPIDKDTLESCEYIARFAKEWPQRFKELL